MGFLFVLSSESFGQNTISFTYDSGGNMIQRQVQVLPQFRFSPPSTPKDSSIINDAIIFKVYPNPTKDFVNVDGELPEGIKEAKLKLYTTTGQELLNEIYSGSLKTISISNLKAGVYYLEVNYSKKKSSTYKIIITN